MDYRDFNGGSSKPEQMNPNWWTLNGEECAQSISTVLNFLGEHQSQRTTQQGISARLYGNLGLVGVNGLYSQKVGGAQPSPIRERISYNVIQSVIDTIVSKMAKNKPVPLFLTSGGDYKMQRRAKKLTKFCEGIFYENRTHALGVEAFRDAAVLADGVVHVYADHQEGRIRHERVLSSELWVDEMEGFYGFPRQMHRCKNVDRAVLLERFPANKSLIETASHAKLGENGSAPTMSDLVTIRESWHLPSGKNAKDGRHVISLDTGVLESEKWEHPWFPFARLPWSKRISGYWSQSLAEQLQNIQLEINKLLWVIQRSMHLSGSFKVLIENTSKIVQEHINNDIGAMIRYTGTPPQYILPPAVPPEIYSHLMTLIQRAYEQAGVSLLSATSQKPAGLNSGKALREFNDIESDRFSVIGHAYEDFFLDISRLSIAAAQELAASDVEIKSKSPSGQHLEVYDWSDVELDEDSYTIKCFPVSSLPNDPAGRLQTIQEYAQAGFLTPRQARRLLNFPDLESIDNLATAEEDYVTLILDKIVDEGEFTSPEPFDDLQLCREMALEYYAQGKVQGLEEERLEMLRQFIAKIQAMGDQAQAEQAQAAQAQQQPTAPQAVPEAPPVSQLLPNAPGAPAAA